MDLSEWAYGLDDLPGAFDGFADGMKRVARPIFNSHLRKMDAVAAVAATVQNIDRRGIEQNGEPVFGHEEKT